MSIEKIDSLLKPLIKKGLKLVPKADGSAGAASCQSKFAGVPYAENGDEWPSCPTCKKELTFVNQINDYKENLLFVFYYCNECFPWGLDGEEKGQWQVKLYKSPTAEKISKIYRQTEDEFVLSPCSISTSTITVLPDWESIDSSSEVISELCSKINDDSPWDVYEEAVIRANCLNDYATLLGGYPRFVQSAVYPNCPQCKSQMEFYAQIDSEDEADVMWGDVGLVYFYRCPKHKNEIHFELQCH